MSRARDSAWASGANRGERMQDPTRILEVATGILCALARKHPHADGIGVTGQMHGILYVNRKRDAVSPLLAGEGQTRGTAVRKDRACAEALSAASRISRDAGLWTGDPLCSGAAKEGSPDRRSALHDRGLYGSEVERRPGTRPGRYECRQPGTVRSARAPDGRARNGACGAQSGSASAPRFVRRAGRSVARHPPVRGDRGQSGQLSGRRAGPLSQRADQYRNRRASLRVCAIAHPGGRTRNTAVSGRGISAGRRFDLRGESLCAARTVFP